MSKHLVLTSDSELQSIISADERYFVRFFKKRADFMTNLKKGDLLYLRLRSEVLAQFSIGKVVLIEGLEGSDFEMLRKFIKDFKREKFDEMARENSVLVVIQIEQLEQFITSPIDVPARIRKEWVVLE